MTDPVYGDNPLDPVEMWNGSFRPALVNDPEWLVWRAVECSLDADVLESQWLTRWRRDVTTAEGAQLAEWGTELRYLQPVGWSGERYRSVLTALMPASFLVSTVEIVANLADALLDVGQTFTFKDEYPGSFRFTYLNTDADDAIAYFTALNRARPSGHQFFLVAHPGGGSDPFTIGTSTIGGTDTLGGLWS